MKQNGIIILGHPRSGTTLTRRLLDAHPNIACPPETHLLSACARFLDADRTDQGVDVGVLAGLSFAGFGDEAVLEKLRTFAFAFLEDYARSQGKPRWAEKTAFDAFHIGNIEKLVGDQAQFIGVVRHPLDVAMSSISFCASMGMYPRDMHSYIQQHNSPIHAFAHSWCDVTEALLDLRRRSGNVLLFRYEDLVETPEATLSSIMQYLGESFEVAQLERGLKEQKDVGFGDHKSYQSSLLHRESVAKWRSLPANQIAALAPLLNPLLDELGYERLESVQAVSVTSAREQYARGLGLLQGRQASERSATPVAELPKKRPLMATPVLYGCARPVSGHYLTGTVRTISFTQTDLPIRKTELISHAVAAVLAWLQRAGEEPLLVTSVNEEQRIRNVAIQRDPAMTFEHVARQYLEGNLTSDKTDSKTSPAVDLVIERSTNDLAAAATQAVEGGNTTPIRIHLYHDEYSARFAVVFDERAWVEETERDRVSEHLEVLLEAAYNSPSQRIDALDLLTVAEGEALNSANSSFDTPQESTFERFAHFVEKVPDHPAVVMDGASLSYRQLGIAVDELAAHLVSQGVSHNTIVAICLERSIDLVVALLAVMRAGATYVPIDPDHPSSRIQIVLEDAQASVIVASDRTLPKLDSASTSRVINLSEKPSKRGVDAPPGVYKPAELAYIIFTSGSTGRPKGVQVRQHGLSTFLAAMRERPGLTCSDRLLSVTTISFDIAALEIFLPLCVGATVHLVNRADTMDGSALIRLIEEHRITCLQATPATYRILIDSQWAGRKGIKLLCGGEAMPPEVAEALLCRCDSLWNMYGPTETTIWSTVKRIEFLDGLVSIGRPIRGTRVYVLNEERATVPLGVIGELYIAGDGVANGYHNRPDLTAERFLPDRFSTVPEARMYRTGDLARVLPDGELECLGRIDNQVKIRGFRIELGDIETALLKLDSVKQCVVDVYEPTATAKGLVAYIVLHDPAMTIDRRSMREHLLPILPEYMVPTEVVLLDELPLTPNNKVDRKALPRPSKSTQPATDSGANTNIPIARVSAKAAGSEREGASQELIIRRWQELLGINDISPSDSFVSLGGDSLSYVKVAMDLEEVLGDLPDDWEEKSIGELANSSVEESAQTASGIETSIALRALAIVLVVFHHALPEAGINGATNVLFMVAGFLFAKFQFDTIVKQESVAPILMSAWRILVPATLIMGGIQFWHGDLRPDVLLLYSNYADQIPTYWFIQVLIQFLLIMAVLLALNPVRVYAAADPWQFGLLLLTIGAILVLVHPIVGPDQGARGQFTHLRFWQFALGWCMFFANTSQRRTFLAHVLVVMACFHFVWINPWHGLDFVLTTVALGFGLLLVPRIQLAKFLIPVTYALAAASLFIFLVHRQVFAIVRENLAASEDLVSLAQILAALAVGYVVWRVWEALARIVTMRRGKSAAVDVG